MDNIRDTQKVEISSSFEKRVLRTNPFGENVSGERAYRRAERIATALYLVTAHISEREPLRGSIRAGVLILLERMLLLKHEMRSPNSREVDESRAHIRRMITLVRILVMGGYLSPQNGQILVEALDDLGGFLSSAQASALSEYHPFSKDDFADAAPPGIIKDIKDRTSTERERKEKDSSGTNTIHLDSSSYSTRQIQILSVLDKGREVSIRDVAAHLPEYSEKMIQRDLADLVALGVVRKEGEKRWSRYSLAPSSPTPSK